jgi:hypothetical protein
MTRIFLVAITLLALATGDIALAKVNNQYAKWKLGQPYGYRDLKILPGRWKIRSMSFHAGMDFPTAMGLHRIAILAKANGFDHFYTVSMKVTCSNLFTGAPSGCERASLDEEVDIIAVGYQLGQPLPGCEEKGVWAANCKDFVADDVLADLRVPLGLTAEQDKLEILAARLISTQPRPTR